MSPVEHAQAQCSAGQSVALNFFFKALIKCFDDGQILSKRKEVKCFTDMHTAIH